MDFLAEFLLYFPQEVDFCCKIQSRDLEHGIVVFLFRMSAFIFDLATTRDRYLSKITGVQL